MPNIFKEIGKLAWISLKSEFQKAVIGFQEHPRAFYPLGFSKKSDPEFSIESHDLKNLVQGVNNAPEDQKESAIAALESGIETFVKRTYKYADMPAQLEAALDVYARHAAPERAIRQLWTWQRDHDGLRVLLTHLFRDKGSHTLQSIKSPEQAIIVIKSVFKASLELRQIQACEEILTEGLKYTKIHFNEMSGAQKIDLSKFLYYKSPRNSFVHEAAKSIYLHEKLSEHTYPNPK